MFSQSLEHNRVLSNVPSIPFFERGAQSLARVLVCIGLHPLRWLKGVSDTGLIIHVSFVVKILIETFCSK